MADRIVLKDYAEITGGALAPVAVKIKLHDNGDGTWSEATPGAGGGGGGAGDASAANQQTQITAEQAISAKLPASLGAKTGAASLSVVPNTDTAFPVSGTFWQATQPVSIAAAVQLAIASATAYSDTNRLPVSESDSLAVTGSVTAAGVLFTQDLTGYKSISVQVTSPGTTCTISYETSDDNVTWALCSGITSATTGSSALASTSTTAIQLQFPRKARYFRARVSTYTSGTVTVVGSASKTSATAYGATLSVGGIAGHGSLVNGGPLRAGGRALTANYATLATGQTADLVTTLVGAVIQKPFSIPEADWNYASAAGGIVNTTAVTLAPAAGAGLRNYLTSISVQNASGTVATEVMVLDGATVLWRGYVGAQTLLNSVVGVTFPSPLKASANVALTFQCVTTLAQVYVNAQGYIAP